MNFPMVIKEIDLGLKTKWLSVAKTTCVKLYLVLMLLDEIVLYILSRFFAEEVFMYFTVSNVSPACIQVASVTFIVLKSSLRKVLHCDRVNGSLRLFKTKLCLDWTIHFSFLIKFLSRTKWFSKHTRSHGDVFWKIGTELFLAKFSKYYLQSSSFLRMH